MKLFTNFWEGEAGAKRILKIAIPLILSTSSFSLMQFIDRKFLASYSTDTFKASAPAGMMTFTIMSIFFGTAAYVNTFIAQNVGARNNKNVGAFLWQGLYFSIFAWIILLTIIPFSENLFNFIGHEKQVARHEVTYFNVLILGSIFVLTNLVLSCFYSGQGKTWTIMWVRFFALSLNIPLDYIMINGKFGLPEMGIMGAGIATLISTAFTTVIFILLIFRKKNIEKFYLIKNMALKASLFKQLLKFGVPNGVHLVIDVFGFTVFILLIGRLGGIELAATNTAWSMNLVAFLPMIGFAIAVTTIVGQAIGEKNIRKAQVATKNTFIMTQGYMLFLAILFITFPNFFISLILPEISNEEMIKIYDLATIYIRFVAAYTVFNSAALIYSSAIKGAGDTYYVMKVAFIMSVVIIIIPSIFFCIIYPQPGIMTWSFTTTYIILMSLIYYHRYSTGEWKNMNILKIRT